MALQTQRHMALDESLLQDLTNLGGFAFVDDIIQHFVEDTLVLLGDLQSAMQAGDVAAFHDVSHAIRSCAGNVGAKLLFDVCHTSQTMDAAWLHSQRLAHLAKVHAAFGAVERQLATYVSTLQPGLVPLQTAAT